MTDIQCPLVQAARRYKDLPALITDSHVVSYVEYNSLVASAASRLRKAGVASGERVAIVSPNTVEYPILLMALFRIGAVACPISLRLPIDAVAEYIKKIGCRSIVNATDHSRKYHVMTLSVADIVNFTGMGATLSADSSISLDQDATIISTSGSSAQPKAVLHSYCNHYYSAIGSNENIKVQPRDCWLLSLPLYHVGGLAILFRAILGGGAVVLPAEGMDILDAVQRYHITHLSLVPTQLYRLLKSPSFSYNTKQLKAVLVGGSAIPKSLIKRAYGSDLPLFTTYGLTEMASQVTTTPPDDSLGRLLTSGKLLEHRQVKISTEGEILVKGDTLFRGYVDEGNISLSLDSEGWFRTGDLGNIDDAGYLTVLGRKDSMFISGGENIYPEQIEGALSLLDGVSDAIVVPDKDDEFGFRPVAFVRTTDNRRTCKKDLVAGLEQLLPRFKIPIHFYEWPVTEPGSNVKPARHYFCELLGTGELRELT